MPFRSLLVIGLHQSHFAVFQLNSSTWPLDLKNRPRAKLQTNKGRTDSILSSSRFSPVAAIRIPLLERINPGAASDLAAPAAEKASPISKIWILLVVLIRGSMDVMRLCHQ
jgi:hypothetical protein